MVLLRNSKNIMDNACKHQRSFKRKMTPKRTRKLKIRKKRLEISLTPNEERGLGKCETHGMYGRKKRTKVNSE